LPWESGLGVATYPVAQLNNRINPSLKPLQLTHRPRPSRTHSFHTIYDANGRMIKASKASIPDAISTYDASGLRVAEKVNDVWRFLIYDVGGKLVTEYGGLQSSDEGGVKYLFSDWQGSTRAVLSNTGTVNARSDYSAFGEEIQAGIGLRTVTQGFGSAQNPRQKYGLTERDDATGLDHTWFRKHENRAGRWTGADPYGGSMSIGDPQSFNRYHYVGNDPLNFIDPSGLDAAGSGTSYGTGILWTLWYGNNIDGWRAIFSWFEAYPGANMGGDASGLARDAFDKFTQANKACLELAKKLGLDKAVGKAKYVTPDKKDLKTKLSTLKFQPGDIGVAAFTRATLADAQAFGVAVTNPHTQTTYLFSGAFKTIGGLDMFLMNLGGTVFHEAFHLTGDGHEEIANDLGLSYDKTIKDNEDRDAAASNALDKFIADGCKKEDKK